MLRCFLMAMKEGREPMRRVREQERPNYIILSFFVLLELGRELINLSCAAVDLSSAGP